MDDTGGKRFLTLVFCMLAVATAGCTDFGRLPTWLPFQEKPDHVDGITAPADRIAQLRILAERGSSAGPDEAQRISVELAESIRTEQDAAIRVEIVHAMGDYSGETAEFVLSAALADADPDVRMAACEAWSRRGGEKAVRILGTVLHSDVDVDVRLMAAWALGQTGDPSAKAALGEALENKDPAMQYQAVTSLRKITGRRFDNDVNQWRQFVKGQQPTNPEPVSIAERFRRMF